MLKISPLSLSLSSIEVLPFRKRRRTHASSSPGLSLLCIDQLVFSSSDVWVGRLFGPGPVKFVCGHFIEPLLLTRRRGKHNCI